MKKLLVELAHRGRTIKKDFSLSYLDFIGFVSDIYLILRGEPLLGVSLLLILFGAKRLAWERQKNRNELRRNAMMECASTHIIVHLQTLEDLDAMHNFALALERGQIEVPSVAPSINPDVTSHDTQSISMSATELYAFVQNAYINELAILSPSCCQGCKYLHGRDDILCAIHPSGLETDYCVDKEGLDD